MKTITKKNVLSVIVVISLIAPLFSVLAPVYVAGQSDRISYIQGQSGVGGRFGHWDPAVSNTWHYNGLEGMLWMDQDVTDDDTGGLNPLLASNWTVYDRVPAGGSNKSGGVQAIAFKLQEGVEFQDGSAWNATVAKWNIDRMIYITGYVNFTWHGNNWFNPTSDQAWFSPEWDLSWAINIQEVSSITAVDPSGIPDASFINYTAGTTDYYIWFDANNNGTNDPTPVGKTGIYVNITAATHAENVSDSIQAAVNAVSGISAANTGNVTLVTSGASGNMTDIEDYDSTCLVSVITDGEVKNPYFGAASNEVPNIANVEIVSEFVINCTINKFTYSPANIGFNMISMVTYADWNETGIGGYGEGSPHAYTESIDPNLQHIVGTGPYIFEYLDANELIAKSVKNENYWNKAGLEARGVFSVDDYYTRWYVDDATKTAALHAGDVDGSTHLLQGMIPDLQSVIDSSYLDYYATIFDPSINAISFTCGDNLDLENPMIPGESIRDSLIAGKMALPAGPITPAKGINRTARLALSWAYDYEGYNTVAYENGNGVLCKTPMGTGSIYNFFNVSAPVLDLTVARDIILNDDPNFAAAAAAANLDADSTDAEWEAVGLGLNPLATYRSLQSTGSPKIDFLESALNSIGMRTSETVIADDIWTGYMYTGLSYEYDIWSYIWLQDFVYPMQWFGQGMALIYKSTALRALGGYNFGFVVNDTMDELLTAAIYNGGSARQDIFDGITDAIMNYHAPALYLGHFEMGIAINAGFNMTWEALERAGPAEVRIIVQYLGGQHLDAPIPAPFIPGFPVIMVGIFSLLSLIGLSYAILKKRRKL